MSHIRGNYTPKQKTKIDVGQLDCRCGVVKGGQSRRSGVFSDAEVVDV
ncbi:hypothetical protein [Alkalimarinus alittae]|uniref:Uncharacterized protein n=1 Tax=Alkalimarinus alittae TaxID=2961619 RepID=A0ABY6N3Y4_9ALTE|nr:hypothetical protein [Alkalimarinus alittae]UZE96729.1 hypothetical protein NKI27_02975 [Alkalimarinus alittae]